MKKIFICITAATLALTSAAQESTLEKNFQRFIDAKDYIGLRVYARKLIGTRLNRNEWAGARQLLIKNISYVGFDTLYTWDREAPQGADSKQSVALKNVLKKADDFLLKEDFANAFNYYQKAATFLKNEKVTVKNVYQSAEILYPYVLEGMGRSLYGLGQYKDSLRVFSWIPPSYPRFRRVLFERMWSSIRMGRADYAIGNLVSQRSAFFSGFAEPEAYLVQAYVYKMFCREDELRNVIKELGKFRTALEKSEYTWRDWARSDVEGIVLTNILERESSKLIPLVSASSRAKERTRIEEALKRAYEKGRAEWLKNINSALAYTHLSTAKNTPLPKVERLPARTALFKKGLEIWPSDDGEEWIDELGSHVYVGDSKCKDLNGYTQR